MFSAQVQSSRIRSRGRSEKRRSYDMLFFLTVRTRLARTTAVKIQNQRRHATDPTVSPRVAKFALGRISIRLSQLQILYTVLPLLTFLLFLQ
jgi:hypothetical protein